MTEDQKSDDERVTERLVLDLKIRFTAARLEHYKAKVRQLEAADAKLIADRAARHGV